MPGVLTMIHSGQVFKGTWNKTDVALKVLKNQAGVHPSSTVSSVFLSSSTMCSFLDPIRPFKRK